MDCNIIINGVDPSIPLYATAWKEISVMEELSIPCQKPNMKKISSVTMDAQVTSFNVVKTPYGTNQEGNVNTGYKVIVKGLLYQLIEYVADDCEHSAHSAHYQVPFCSYIVLPDDFEEGNAIEVRALVEDVYVKQLDCRNFFKNVTIFLYADITCGIANVPLPVAAVTSANPVNITPTVTTTSENNFDVAALITDPAIAYSFDLVIAPTPAETVITPDSTLPTGYTFDTTTNTISVASPAEDATLTFTLREGACTTTLTINVDIQCPVITTTLSTVDQPGNVITTVTPNSTNNFTVTGDINDPSVPFGFDIVIAPTPATTPITPVGTLPAGYTFDPATKTISVADPADDATLTFTLGSGLCTTTLTINVDLTCPINPVLVSGTSTIVTNNNDPNYAVEYLQSVNPGTTGFVTVDSMPNLPTPISLTLVSAPNSNYSVSGADLIMTPGAISGNVVLDIKSGPCTKTITIAITVS